jgi:hypothetical protein
LSGYPPPAPATETRHSSVIRYRRQEAAGNVGEQLVGFVEDGGECLEDVGDAGGRATGPGYET